MMCVALNLLTMVHALTNCDVCFFSESYASTTYYMAWKLNVVVVSVE